MTQFKLVNGISIPLSSDEQADYDARVTAYNATLSDRILADVAAHRYSVQNGGYTYNPLSATFKTDAESRLALLGIWTVANANSEFSVSNWKLANGTFIPLSNSQIIAVGNAILAFIQKCFNSEENIKANISSYSNSASAISAFNNLMAS